MAKIQTNGWVALIVLLLWLGAAAGYIMNIFKLISLGMNNEMSTMFVLRVVGLFPPVGAILGYF